MSERCFTSTAIIAGKAVTLVFSTKTAHSKSFERIHLVNLNCYPTDPEASAEPGLRDFLENP